MVNSIISHQVLEVEANEEARYDLKNAEIQEESLIKSVWKIESKFSINLIIL